eukprot:TRINITY_DN1965_c0_g1_i1.p1 TRINITY_DN1965_c0_g1~~TRINITY_DN1965_c0_g1_i1.p1  ORF type:complete len:155 (-),score=17.09 TRINITY_DN1965_c0_g1_i1:579-1043(-)
MKEMVEALRVIEMETPAGSGEMSEDGYRCKAWCDDWMVKDEFEWNGRYDETSYCIDFNAGEMVPSADTYQTIRFMLRHDYWDQDMDICIENSDGKTCVSGERQDQYQAYIDAPAASYRVTSGCGFFNTTCTAGYDSPEFELTYCILGVDLRRLA